MIEGRTEVTYRDAFFAVDHAHAEPRRFKLALCCLSTRKLIHVNMRLTCLLVPLQLSWAQHLHSLLGSLNSIDVLVLVQTFADNSFDMQTGLSFLAQGFRFGSPGLNEGVDEVFWGHESSVSLVHALEAHGHALLLHARVQQLLSLNLNLLAMHSDGLLAISTSSGVVVFGLVVGLVSIILASHISTTVITTIKWL
jgi:hypothetical protein